MSELSVYDVATFVTALAAIVWLVRTIFTGNDERYEEEEARQFFDEHGHWPDEDPSQADRRYHL